MILHQYRSGDLALGDEIVNIDGKRLRGVGLETARQILSGCSRTAEAVVVRTEEQEEDEEEVREREDMIVLWEESVTVIRVREATGVDTPHMTRHCDLPDTDPPDPSHNNQIFSVQFEKGPGRPPLGFSVVGGSDSAKGSLGIFVKTVMTEGQASGHLSQGDQILSVNGQTLRGVSHGEAISVFKRIRSGEVRLQVVRRPAWHRANH